MSHLKRLPALISMLFAPSAKFGAVMFSGLLVASGCAVVQIPSYRLEECAAESYSNGVYTDEVYSDESCSSPPIVLPSIPMPGWLARWKAEKDLPKPPAAPRFHPLPTRPMFQPKPDTGMEFGAPGEAACYGTLPPAESWNGVEHVPAVQVPTVAEPL